MKDLVIIGAGGFGREVIALVERINRVSQEWNILGFLDDNDELCGTSVNGYKVLGNTEYAAQYKNAWFICAVGISATRKRIIEKLENYHLKYATLVDPDVVLLDSERTIVQEGSIICAGSILTVDISIGSHVIINIGCTIGHDDIIGNYCTINPGVNISGAVSLGECIDVGTGTQIIQGKIICGHSVIGAGSVLLKDVEKAGLYVGVPAKHKFAHALENKS